MRKPDRRFLLAALGATGLSACAGPFKVGDGKKPPKGGIGGTGIVGTLTDFGSLIVNGLKIELDQTTKVLDIFGSTSQDRLFLGQNLTIEAATEGDNLVGKRVLINHPVIGTIEKVDASGTRAIVADVQVQLEPSAIGALIEGQRVAVSGAWRGTTVVASRIDPIDGRGPSAIAGVVEQQDGRSAASIAAVPILTDAGRLPDPGSFVSVIGSSTARGFVPQEVTAGRFVGAAGSLTNLSIEWDLEPSSSAPFHAVSGLGHSFDRAAKLSPFQRRRTIFTGPYEGSFVVSQGLFVPEDFAERRDLIARIVRGEASPDVLSAR